MRRLIALLTIHRDQIAAFEAYERAAARILARHGAVIEHAYRLETNDDTVRELHVVQFPDDAALAAYRADAALAALAPERARVTIATEIWAAEPQPPY